MPFTRSTERLNSLVDAYLFNFEQIYTNARMAMPASPLLDLASHAPLACTGSAKAAWAWCGEVFAVHSHGHRAVYQQVEATTAGRAARAHPDGPPRARTCAHATRPMPMHPCGTATAAWQHFVASALPQTAAEATSQLCQTGRNRTTRTCDRRMPP